MHCIEFLINEVKINVSQAPLKYLTLGLANPVPGPSRGMLFHLALIFVVVVPDAGLKKPYKFFENCMLANIFSFPDGPSRSLIYVGM